MMRGSLVKKANISLTTTMKLILSIPGLLILILLATGLYAAFTQAPDQNIATLDIIIGEIDTGVRLMELRSVDEYKIVFPLSLEPGYTIITDNSKRDKNEVTIKLWSTEGEVEIEKITLRGLTFQIPGDKPAGEFVTQRSTLSNYELTIKAQGGKTYAAHIKYCEDGWCDKATRSIGDSTEPLLILDESDKVDISNVGW